MKLSNEAKEELKHFNILNDKGEISDAEDFWSNVDTLLDVSYIDKEIVDYLVDYFPRSSNYIYDLILNNKETQDKELLLDIFKNYIVTLKWRNSDYENKFYEKLSKFVDRDDVDSNLISHIFPYLDFEYLDLDEFIYAIGWNSIPKDWQREILIHYPCSAAWEEVEILPTDLFKDIVDVYDDDELSEFLEHYTYWDREKGKLSKEEIEYLYNNTDYSANYLAKLDNLPEHIIYELLEKEYEDANIEVAEDLASHPNLNKKAMLLLSSDENVDVRKKLAANPNLTEELMIKLSSDKDWNVRYGLADNINLTGELMILLSSNEYPSVSYNAFGKLKKLNSLKKEELEEAYDLINNSKHIGRENFEETFDYIANKFPELTELAKMFKTIILKGKKDFK